MRIGIPEEYFAEGLDPEVGASVRAAVAELEKEGCVVRPVSLPHTRFAVATYYVLATAEASSNLARFDGVRYGLRATGSDGKGAADLRAMYGATRDAGFGAEVKRRILLGTFVLSSGYYDAYYGKAQRVRTLVRRDFEQALREVDVLCSPTAPTPPFRLGEKIDDPLAMYLGDVYTLPASLAGVPAISVPCAMTKAGLPVGLQIIARPLEEASMLRIAAAWEARAAAGPKASAALGPSAAGPK
jgi:aspartyl-tRNA(Asn)/glutamyl-tRNA(Gln) amidotransferase subunit A